jgi:hypothetical protein
MRCPGSVKANEQITDKGSAYAAEGTAAHALAEHCLVKGVSASDCIGLTFEGHKVDSYMAEYVQQYIDYVRQFSGQHFYEVRVDFSEWVPEGFGTSDVIIIDGSTLRIIDLKYGQGVEVYADNNSQAQLYALGALSEFGDFAEIERVEVAIVQPRRDHISEWSISKKDLLVFGDKVSQAAKDALQPDAPRQPGEKQCQWCNAKATCPALKTYTEQTVLAEFDDISPATLPPVDTLTDEQLAQALDAKKLITGWLDAVEQLVTDKLNNGEQFTGYKLVEGRSLRQWADEAQAEQTLLQLADADKLYKKSFISVAQAEKLLGKKNAAAMADLVVKPSGKPTLAKADDPRPPIGATLDDFSACND